MYIFQRPQIANRAILLVFEKSTRAYLFQIALEIIWLPTQTEFKTAHVTYNVEPPPQIVLTFSICIEILVSSFPRIYREVLTSLLFEKNSLFLALETNVKSSTVRIGSYNWHYDPYHNHKRRLRRCVPRGEKAEKHNHIMTYHDKHNSTMYLFLL